MTKDNSVLMIATKNIGKTVEITKMLENSPLILRSLNDFPEIEEPVETGATFIENAVLKARYYALQTGIQSLADDSGLEVQALNGAPGVLSARYAGADATDKQRVSRLLEEISVKQNQNRNARFVCAMAIAGADGKVKYTTEGICEGKIAASASGTNGFGYDSVFIPEGFLETFGELSSDAKQQLSHRARAINKIIEYLCRSEADLI